MRFSRRREAIYRTVCGTDSHPNAEWVYARVRGEIPGISLGTVYRNLRSLSDEGKLMTLETEDGKAHFDGCTSPHAHFVCKACGKIVDCDSLQVCDADLVDAGYRIDTVKTVAYGICPACRSASAPD